MLSYLHVKNLALIDEVEVEFGPGLNILTGETGAGKSILMGAVNLALGQKMSKSMIRDPKKPGFVELVFQVNNESCLQLLKEKDIFVEDGQIIISRTMTGNRSISRINGEVCNVTQIREISTLLLDIHGQHEHQSLLYQEHQLRILDEYGKGLISGLKENVKKAFQEWNSVKKELESYQMDEESRKREISFLEFELQEIEEAALIPGEDEELEERYKIASNSKRILEALEGVSQFVGNDMGAGDSIGRAIQELSRVDHGMNGLNQLTQMLEDVENLLFDIQRETSNCMDEFTFSDEEFYEMDQRLNVLNHLKSKYGQTVEAILDYQKKKQAELDRLNHYEAYKEKLQRELKLKEEKLRQASMELSKRRKHYAKHLEDAIHNGLKDLNFLNVEFEIKFTTLKNFTANGNDKIEFCISTNPGEPVRPLANVVSGGELSRIMLAIKAILADKDETETLIFDEIDTGISGRTAQKVSEKMAVIGRNHQVLCITHLPQIAAMADLHFEIAKSVIQGETKTNIHMLDETESIQEIARILGGAEITEHTMANASEMKDLARKLKNTRV